MLLFVFSLVSLVSYGVAMHPCTIMLKSSPVQYCKRERIGWIQACITLGLYRTHMTTAMLHCFHIHNTVFSNHDSESCYCFQRVCLSVCLSVSVCLLTNQKVVLEACVVVRTTVCVAGILASSSSSSSSSSLFMVDRPQPVQIMVIDKIS